MRNICTRIIFVFSILSVSSPFLKAQGLERGRGTSANASQVYFELGGAGIIYSFNYDGRFDRYENGLGFRVGIGGASANGSGYFALPLQLNYLAGSRGRYVEFGGGVTYAPNLDIFGNRSNTFGTLAIGFRMQPLGRKGFTFRAVFSPIIGLASGGGFIPSAGISWGFRF
jgi:hypothetical protein